MWFDSAGRQFDKGEADGVTVLALEDYLGIAGVLRLVDGEDDDRSVVANDVAGVDKAVGLFDLIGDDGEDLAFVSKFGGDEAGFGRLFPAGGCRGAGCLYFGGHKAKVSSCI